MRRPSPALLLIASLAASGCALRPIWNPPNTGETSSDASARDAAAFADAGPIIPGDASYQDVGQNPSADSAAADYCDPANAREGGVAPDGGCPVDAGADAPSDASPDDAPERDALAGDAALPTDGASIESDTGGEGGP